tara:strand:+ start:806 stop:1306 length:501 start_codon:yes stop_codon:yes gene_type:complete
MDDEDTVKHPSALTPEDVCDLEKFATRFEMERAMGVTLASSWTSIQEASEKEKTASLVTLDSLVEIFHSDPFLIFPKWNGDREGWKIHILLRPETTGEENLKSILCAALIRSALRHELEGKRGDGYEECVRICRQERKLLEKRFDQQRIQTVSRFYFSLVCMSSLK